MAPKAPQRVSLAHLVESQLLQPGEQIVFDEHYATLMANGDLYTGEPGDIPDYLQSTYQSLSAWCSDVRKRGRDSSSTVSGWIRARLASDPSRTLDAIRRQFTEMRDAAAVAAGLVDPADVDDQMDTSVGVTTRGARSGASRPQPNYAEYSEDYPAGTAAGAGEYSHGHHHHGEEHDPAAAAAYMYNSDPHAHGAHHQHQHQHYAEDDSNGHYHHYQHPHHHHHHHHHHDAYGYPEEEDDPSSSELGKQPRQSRFQQMVELAGQEGWVDDERDGDFTESSATGRSRNRKTAGSGGSSAGRRGSANAGAQGGQAAGPPAKKARAAASNANLDDFSSDSHDASGRGGGSAAAGKNGNYLGGSPSGAPLTSGAALNGAAGSTDALAAHHHHHLGAAAVPSEEPIPTPSVVVFPLTTDSKQPDPLVFRSTVSCVDCSAVLHPGDSYLTCNSCAEAHHHACTPLYICPPPANPGDAWICIFCTFCSKCSKNSPRDQLALCSACDRVFHLDCVNVSPDMVAADGTIICNDCASCYSCGLKPRGSQVVGPPLWTRHPVHNAYQCQLCTTYYDAGNFCPVCYKAYSEDDFETPMVGCDGKCSKWVHKTCDPILQNIQYDDLHDSNAEYVCPNCRSPHGSPAPLPLLLPAVPAGGAPDVPPPHARRTRSGEGAASSSAATAAAAVAAGLVSAATTGVGALQLDGLDHAAAGASLDSSASTASAAPAATPAVATDSLPPSDAQTALAVYVDHRRCAFCAQDELHKHAGVGRLVFLGGNDPEGLGLGLWGHIGCAYWSLPEGAATETPVDETYLLGVLEYSRARRCGLCKLPFANLHCGAASGACSTAYHWSCLIRALFAPSIAGLADPAGTPAEIKRARKVHLDVLQKQFRCATHAAPGGNKGGATYFQPQFTECEQVCAMRLAIAHDPTVPLYVSAVPAARPGKLLTTAPPYNPACLVVGGAAVTHIGRLPFDDPNLLIEAPIAPAPLLVAAAGAAGADGVSPTDTEPGADGNAAAAAAAEAAAPPPPLSPPCIIPVGYTVVRRFWSYRVPGATTFLTMTRTIAGDVADDDPAPAGPLVVDAASHFSDMTGSAAMQVEPVDEGIVVQGEETPDTMVVDRYSVDADRAATLRWRVHVADDPAGTFEVAHTAEILPALLERFDAAPYPIAVNHHYLRRPESLVLLHHPTIVRFIENLPHAAQCTAYPFRFVDPAALNQIREAERTLRRGSSRTDPAIISPRIRQRAALAAAAAAGGGAAVTGARVRSISAVGGGAGLTSPTTTHPRSTDAALPFTANAAAAPVPTTAAPVATASTGAPPTAAVAQPWESAVPLPLQYAKLKEQEKGNIAVRPSKIQGIGLFAARAFAANDMVIEYLGEVIGQKVADTRELVNDRHGVGTYFFAIAHDRILDATHKGNAARFINHSCEPNCYARIVAPLDGVKRVIIYAARRVEAGEELTYDYKFQLEEAAEKRLPCYCGAPRCRKFMN
ncbi:hypothetical protein H9P43_005863 [Blastocladiella emersonii ATCC 22665]|nr:hypothetical protein H9P43_005863 [Blastocladiella emersonii ATCC 22665]